MKHVRKALGGKGYDEWFASHSPIAAQRSRLATESWGIAFHGNARDAIPVLFRTHRNG